MNKKWKHDKSDGSREKELHTHTRAHTHTHTHIRPLGMPLSLDVDEVLRDEADQNNETQRDNSQPS